jgi:hypothetical protein
MMEGTQPRADLHISVLQMKYNIEAQRSQMAFPGSSTMSLKHNICWPQVHLASSRMGWDLDT